MTDRNTWRALHFYFVALLLLCRFLVPIPSRTHFPLPFLVFLARDTRRWIPPFCACIVTPSTGPPSHAARCYNASSHSWHCYRYCYYYRYCCRLRPSGEWKSRESQRASCCVECRIRGKLHSSPPLGLSIEAFILLFCPLFSFSKFVKFVEFFIKTLLLIVMSLFLCFRLGI